MFSRIHESSLHCTDRFRRAQLREQHRRMLLGAVLRRQAVFRPDQRLRVPLPSRIYRTHVPREHKRVRRKSLPERRIVHRRNRQLHLLVPAGFHRSPLRGRHRRVHHSEAVCLRNLSKHNRYVCYSLLYPSNGFLNSSSSVVQGHTNATADRAFRATTVTSSLTNAYRTRALTTAAATT